MYVINLNKQRVLMATNQVYMYVYAVLINTFFCKSATFKCTVIGSVSYTCVYAISFSNFFPIFTCGFYV